MSGMGVQFPPAPSITVVRRIQPVNPMGWIRLLDLDGATACSLSARLPEMIGADVVLHAVDRPLDLVEVAFRCIDVSVAPNVLARCLVHCLIHDEGLVEARARG